MPAAAPIPKFPAAPLEEAEDEDDADAPV